MTSRLNGSRSAARGSERYRGARAATLGLPLVLVAGTLPALAQERPSGASAEPQAAELEPEPAVVSIAGILRDWRRVTSHGPLGRTWLRLRFESGESVVVDVGSRTDVSDVALESGAYVSVVGREWRPEGIEVLRASAIHVRPRAEGAERRERASAAGPWRAELEHSDWNLLHGTVEPIEAEGAQPESAWLGLRLENGALQVVDLGPPRHLGTLWFDEGERVAVQGTHVRVEGLDVLLARRVVAQGRRWTLPSAHRAVAREAIHRREPRDASFGGELDSVRAVRVDGAPRDHHLIRIELHDGLERLVDLGTILDASDLGLHDARTVEVRGTQTRIRGRDVVLAEEVLVDGLPFQVPRG